MKISDNNDNLHSYTYDGIGNRLSHTTNNQTENYNYLNDIQLNIISDSINNTTTLQYDDAGNIVEKGNIQLSYNQTGQLKEVSNDNNVTEYSYNHLRQRIVKKQVNGSEIYYQYLPDGRLLTETDANGTVYKYYIWLEQQLLAVLDKTLTSSTAQLLYAHNDHLNTVTALSDITGHVVWQAKYSPFGSGSIDEDVDNDGINIQFNLRFPGQYYDKESALHYNHHRYYDPQTGRYITSDPIGLSGGINTYGYVGGNPIMLADPLGLTEKDIKMMLCFARANSNAAASFGPQYQDLNIPFFDELGFERMENKTGRVSFFGSVILSNKYLAKMSHSGRVELFNTIIHESSHLKQPWGLRGSDRHETIGHTIGDTLADEFKDDILNNNIGNCSCEM